MAGEKVGSGKHPAGRAPERLARYPEHPGVYDLGIRPSGVGAS